MNRSVYKGKTFVASILEPDVKTGLMVVCYPGSGEAFGTPDGAMLSVIKYGFDETKEWPFTIVKVQTLSKNFQTAWAEIMNYIENNSSSCVLVGWSLGAREVMDMLLGFLGRTLSSKVKLIVAIDGPGSGSPDYSKASVPVIMISGNKGIYYYPLRTQHSALLGAGKQATFIEMDNLDHSALMRFTYGSQTIINAITDLLPHEMEYKIVSITVKDNVMTFTDEKGKKYLLNVSKN